MSISRYPIRPGGGPFTDANTDTTGAQVGRLVAVAEVDPLGFELIDAPEGGGTGGGAEADYVLTLARGEAVRAGAAVPVGAASTWTVGVGGTAGTVTDGFDPAVGKYVRLSTTTAGAWYRVGRALVQDLGGGRAVSFKFRRVDANLSTWSVHAGLGTVSATNPANIDPHSVAGVDVGVWYTITLHPAVGNDVGTISASARFDLQAFAIQAVPVTGQNTAVDVADFRVHTDSTPTPRVGFMFDDATTSQYTEAFTRLAAKGWAAGIAVEHTSVTNGAADALTVAQLDEMYAAGWDFYGHHTAQMTSLSETDQRAVHSASRSFLAAHGYQRGDRIWVWPGGAHSAATEAIAFEYWSTLRRTQGSQSIGYAHVYDPRAPSVFYWTSTTPYANLIARLDKIKAAGGACVIVLHDIVTSGATAEQVLISNFQNALDYITTIGGIDVVPASQLWTL